MKIYFFTVISPNTPIPLFVQYFRALPTFGLHLVHATTVLSFIADCGILSFAARRFLASASGDGVGAGAIVRGKIVPESPLQPR